MRRFFAVTLAVAVLLLCASVGLAQDSCPPEAKVQVSQPVYDSNEWVSGWLQGIECPGAAVEIHHTDECESRYAELVGTGSVSDGINFSVPLDAELSSCWCGDDVICDIAVRVACPCGPVSGRVWVYSSELITPLPPEVQTVRPGDTVIVGQPNPGWAVHAGADIYVLDQMGGIIGRDVVQADGSFSVELNRPLATGDTITLHVQGITVAHYQLPPVEIPEPAALLLLGSGLVAVAGGAAFHWRRRATSPGRS